MDDPKYPAAQSPTNESVDQKGGQSQMEEGQIADQYSDDFGIDAEFDAFDTEFQTIMEETNDGVYVGIVTAP